VGGFLAPEPTWSAITTAWAQRIDHENRISTKKGFPPISRYHATDCANLKKEFSEKNGWDIPRQIRLTKRLCEILGQHSPCGIVIGGGIDNIQRYLAPGNGDQAKAFLYTASFKMFLLEVAGIMVQRFPRGRVKFFYERGEFEPIAKSAFDDFMKEASVAHLAEFFVGAEPKGWEDCIALQAADFMAYQGMQRVNGSLRGKNEIKKSLNALIGKNIPIEIVHYTDENFADLLRMSKNQREGRPLEEGIHSGLQACLGGFHHTPAS
jgi:hypothetical protein